MAELILHFAAADGTDLDTTAAGLQEQIAAFPGVESAEAAPERLRAVGLAEIVAVITLATTAVQAGTAALDAIRKLLEAWQKLHQSFHGLHQPAVEVGMRKVPIDQLTDEDLQELIEP